MNHCVICYVITQIKIPLIKKSVNLQPGMLTITCEKYRQYFGQKVLL